jgi:hypothetical protein
VGAKYTDYQKNQQNNQHPCSRKQGRELGEQPKEKVSELNFIFDSLYSRLVGKASPCGQPLSAGLEY